MQNSNVTKITISSNNGSPNFNSITEQISESKQNVEMDTSLPKEMIPEVLLPSPKPSKEKEIDSFLNKVHKKKVKKKHQAQETLQTHSEEKMPQEIKYPTSDPVIHDQKRVTGSSRSHKKKEIDELKHELFNPLSKSDGPSSINHNNMSEISKTTRPRKVTYDSIDEALQYLAQLCDKAINAEDRTNRANQEKILCWCLYWKDFRNQLDEIIKSNSGKFGEKKARSMLYDTITEQLSILRKKRSQELGLKVLSLEAGHVFEIFKTARPGKKLPEVNAQSTPQIILAKADDNNLTDLKEEDFCSILEELIIIVLYHLSRGAYHALFAIENMRIMDYMANSTAKIGISSS
ncbi:2565_t:CDS:2 [Gigaspora margarita]|uniref:2565_t:CDS:1 n=1 Tax=Gigaspora margarita TaxID=4874 RepID=A0ABN7UIQ7_GIGMA|nr:2565_t:CDS:2 [Gigaspora margarita]